MLKLGGASTNKQTLVVMPTTWNERIDARLTEWTNEPMNQRSNESMKQWVRELCNDSMISRTNDGMQQWPHASVNVSKIQRIKDGVTLSLNHQNNESLESSEYAGLCTCWLGHVPPATMACAFSKAQLPKVLGPQLCILLIWFASQQHALFQHLNFQKRSEHEVLSEFWLRDAFRTITTSTFSTSQLLKMLRTVSFWHFWKPNVLRATMAGEFHLSSGQMALSLIWSSFFSSLLFPDSSHLYFFIGSNIDENLISKPKSIANDAQFQNLENP